METYKKDQGKLTRRVAFFALAVFVVWGGHSFYGFLVNTFDFARKAFVGGVNGWNIPLLDQRTNYGFLIAAVVTVVGVWMLWRLLNRPRQADFLIETDEEMHKVTWPSWKDAWSSSVIVLVFVAMLTLFLWLADRAIYGVMALMLA